MVTIAQAFESYLRDLAVGQSAQTVETYSQGLARLREFLALNRCPPSQPVSILTVTHALGCAQWLSDERETRSGKLAKATLRTYLATLSRFYSYLLREELVSLSAADLQRMRRLSRTIAAVMSARCQNLHLMTPCAIS
jgi:site-specific recombinase XerD